MTAALSLTAPLVVAGIAVAVRRRFGSLASWVFLLGLILIVGRYGVGPVFWNRPAFLASMSEDLGAMFGLLVLALLLGEWKRDRPPAMIQWVIGSLLLIGIQWALARWHITDLMGKSVLVAIVIWILSQIFRGIRYLFRARSAGITTA